MTIEINKTENSKWEMLICENLEFNNLTDLKKVQEAIEVFIENFGKEEIKQPKWRKDQNE